MITQSLMKPGRFDVRLKRSTPLKVMQALDWTVTPTAGFGMLYVFPTRIPAAQLNSTNLRAAARFAGILREWTDDFSFGGPSNLAWLGDEDGKGAILEAEVSGSSATLSTWVSNLRPASLSAGTVTNPGSNYTGRFQWVTPRTALDAISAALSTEYRVNPDGTLDAGTQAVLWGTTPTAIVTRNLRTRTGAGQLRGIRASRLVVARDLKDYSTKVRTLGKAGIGTASAAATPYKDPNGNAVVMIRVTEVPDNEDASSAATALVNRFGTARNAIRLQSDEYNISGDVVVGAYIYVYDPITGLVGTDMVAHEGERFQCTKLRVYSITYPIRQGMGVAFRDGNGNWTDLSDWVEYEDGDGTIDVGDYPRTMMGTVGVGSGQYGPQIEEGRWVPYAPTITQGGSVTCVVNYARWKRDGRTVHVEGDLFVTGAGTGGNIVVVSVPVNYADTTYSGNKGGAMIYDASVTTRYICAAEYGGASLVGFSSDGANANLWGATPNIALANSDVIRYQLCYEGAF